MVKDYNLNYNTKNNNKGCKIKTDNWQNEIKDTLYNVGHRHIVFTVPEGIMEPLDYTSSSGKNYRFGK